MQTAVRKLHRLIEYGTTLFFPPCSTFSLKCLLLLYTVRNYRFFLFLIPHHDSTIHEEEIFMLTKYDCTTRWSIYIIHICIYVILKYTTWPISIYCIYFEFITIQINILEMRTCPYIYSI